MEAKPRFESGTTCRGVLGNPKLSTRTFCVNRPRGTTRFIMLFDRRQAGKHAARQAFLIFNRNTGSLKWDRLVRFDLEE